MRGRRAPRRQKTIATSGGGGHGLEIVSAPPCVIFEDDHLLVVNKPPGWNTHAPAPFAGEGIYDWLKAREPRWATLAIIHRLDKETSGVLVFSKTREANRSLTQQFTEGEVRKVYRFLTERRPEWSEVVAKSMLRRAGEKYVEATDGVEAVTEFRVVGERDGFTVVEARPRTGRTHQIRVHAAARGVAIVGDPLYAVGNTKAAQRRRTPRPGGDSGGPVEPRLCLHARVIEFEHPTTGEAMRFEFPEDFEIPVWRARRSFIDAQETDAFRWIHGASDGFEGWQVDQLGDCILSQAPEGLARSSIERLEQWFPSRSVYHKTLTARVRGITLEEVCPQRAAGRVVEAPFSIRENGVKFEISFQEGYSIGLFPDQRDNRRRLLKNYVGVDFPLDLKGKEALNTFAYTCGFSVCAALGGARVTSLDLSKKYLEWGKRNFALNEIDPDAHDFIYGDVFDWMRRLGKKGRKFDLILLDPPTFSKSKESGVFRVEQDYPGLVTEALKLLRPNGVLFASSNAAKLEPEDFLRGVRGAIREAKRAVLREIYYPQPPDFPVSREDGAYLKTVWFRVT